MEQAFVTKGHLKTPRKIILDENISGVEDSFEIIIRPIKKDKKNRKAGTLKGLIHIKDDFDKPLDDFKEYM
jgi:hypothetical protein